MKIEIIKDAPAYEGKNMRTIKRHFSHKGELGVWEFVERKKSGPSVAIFALTKQKEVILEKIFRVPFGLTVIELPAGLTDVTGEPYEETAKRELLEETGYAAENLIKILQGPVSPGALTEEMIIYFGKDAEKITTPTLGISEDIEVFTLPWKELVPFVQKNQEIMKIDIKILSALSVLISEGYLS